MFRSSVTSCSHQDDLQEEEFVLVQDFFWFDSRHSLETSGAPLEFQTKLCDAHFQVLLPFLSSMSHYELFRKYQLYTSPSFTKPSLKHKEKGIRPHLCSFDTFSHILCCWRWTETVVPECHSQIDAWRANISHFHQTFVHFNPRICIFRCRKVVISAASMSDCDAALLYYFLFATLIICSAEWRVLSFSFAAAKAVKHGCRLLFDH